MRLTRTFFGLRFMLRTFCKSEFRGESRPMTKRTTIKITRESFFLLYRSSARLGWCSSCAREVEMLSLERACIFCGGEPASFAEWLETAGVHRSRSADGSLFICLGSLLDRLQNKNMP